MFSLCACLARLARFTAKSNHPLLPAMPVAQATRPLSRLTIETAKLYTHFIHIFIYFWNLLFISDINECENIYSNDCNGGNECVNTVGSYVCRCPKGFHYNNFFRLCFGKSAKLQINVRVVLPLSE